jgi:predicted peptidase
VAFAKRFLCSMIAICISGQCFAQQMQEVAPRLGYLLYLPKHMYSAHKKWPLILYLHGKSLRGNDLSRVAAYGLPKRLLKDKGFPFIVLCPQLPSDQRWTDTAQLASLVNEVARNYPVDRKRVYAMGFSMGASGVWRVAAAYPSMFGALVCVGGMYEMPIAQSGKLKSLPVWMIHGEADTEASEQSAKTFFDMFVMKGGRGKFEALIGKGHNIPGVFDRSDLYKWLLLHKAGQNKVQVVSESAPSSGKKQKKRAD